MEQKTINNCVTVLNSNMTIKETEPNSVREFDVTDSASILIGNCNENSSIKINVKKGVEVKLSVLCKNSIENLKIFANLEENAKFDAYFADFSTGKGKATVEINLNGRFADARWHLASLSANKDNKEFNVSISHKEPETFGQSDNYGVCKDEGRLVFSGISSIAKGCEKSKTNQNAKIMVFDEKSNGVAKPILKIDENDIEASHAAIVGKINDEHLFYLTSRGLTEEQAKQLITFGYLKPILNGFDEGEIRDEINSLIEGRM